jgi:hypothetical protein
MGEGHPLADVLLVCGLEEADVGGDDQVGQHVEDCEYAALQHFGLHVHHHCAEDAHAQQREQAHRVVAGQQRLPLQHFVEEGGSQAAQRYQHEHYRVLGLLNSQILGHEGDQCSCAAEGNSDEEEVGHIES